MLGARNAHRTDKYLRRQRQKQLQNLVNPSVTGQVKRSLHSSDIHRRVQGTQLGPIVFELVVVNDLRVMVLTLEIDTSEEFDHAVFEMHRVARVLVQRWS